MSIGSRLRQLRKANKLSGDQLGQMCGVTKSMVSQWESGTTTPPTDRLIELRRHINFSFDWLLTGIASSDESTNGAGHAVREFAWVYAHATDAGKSLLLSTVGAVRKAYTKTAEGSKASDER